MNFTSGLHSLLQYLTRLASLFFTILGSYCSDIYRLPSFSGLLDRLTLMPCGALEVFNEGRIFLSSSTTQNETWVKMSLWFPNITRSFFLGLLGEYNSKDCKVHTCHFCCSRNQFYRCARHITTLAKVNMKQKYGLTLSSSWETLQLQQKHQAAINLWEICLKGGYTAGFCYQQYTYTHTHMNTELKKWSTFFQHLYLSHTIVQ